MSGAVVVKPSLNTGCLILAFALRAPPLGDFPGVTSLTCYRAQLVLNKGLGLPDSENKIQEIQDAQLNC